MIEAVERKDLKDNNIIRRLTATSVNVDRNVLFKFCDIIFTSTGRSTIANEPSRELFFAGTEIGVEWR
jgi:hypothetical protein